MTALYLVGTLLMLQPVGAGAVQPASGDSVEARGVGACTVRVVDIDPPVGVLIATLLRADADYSGSTASATRAMRVLGPELAVTLDSIPYGAYRLRLSQDTTGKGADKRGETTTSRDEARAAHTPPTTAGDAFFWETDFVLEDSVCQIEASMRDASPHLAVLAITMAGFRNEKGVAQVTLFNRANGFPHKPDLAFMHGSSPIVTGVSQITFEQVPFGTYGVGVIHDENANERMDTNFLGKPQEGYGASNDARGRFGPPSFEDARFSVAQDTVTIVIAITY